MDGVWFQPEKAKIDPPLHAAAFDEPCAHLGAQAPARAVIWGGYFGSPSTRSARIFR